MDKPQLRQTLEQLHAELERTESVDAETREGLRHLMSDIHGLLEENGQPPAHRSRTLNARLQEALLQLEVSHPHLALNVERVLDALNEMGI